MEQLLSRLQHYAKAVYPALVTLATAVVHAGFTGEWNLIETEAAVLAIVIGAFVLVLPNDAGGVKIHPGEPIDTGPPEDLPKKVGRKIKDREFTTLGTDVQTEYEGPPERKPTKKSR